MFLTSGGGLTAGGVSPDGRLFPYETVDKLHDGHHHTGPDHAAARAPRRGGPVLLWQPFSERAAEDSRVERNLYKNVIGNRLVFEEIHHDLGLAFRYRWSASDEFGCVRTATLANLGARGDRGLGARRPAERAALRRAARPCTSRRAASSTPTSEATATRRRGSRLSP